MCCCCSPSVAGRTLALLSILIAIALIGTSSWVLKDTYELRESTGYQAIAKGGKAIQSVGTFLGTDTDFDVDKKNRILLACSAVGVTAGGLQLLASILLLVGAGSKSRSPSAIFSFVNMLGVIGVIGSLVCLFYNKIFDVDIDRLDGMEDQKKYWLGALIGDGVFLLISVCSGISIMRS